MSNSNSTFAPYQVALPQSYTLNQQFSDEFDVTELDLTRWYDFTPAWLGREPGFFDRNNVRIVDKTLHLSARALSEKDLTLEQKARGYDRFSTAFVRSCERLRYGFFECRFKSMNARVCNAFWLNDPLDPPEKWQPGNFCEEIDIFEVFGNNPDDCAGARHYYTTLHRMDTPYVEAKVCLNHSSQSNTFKNPEDFHSTWHIGALWWTPEFLRWYLNGELVFEVPNDLCHRALYLNVDCEIMAKWVGEPETTELPADFIIDYLRVWQDNSDS